MRRIAFLGTLFLGSIAACSPVTAKVLFRVEASPLPPADKTGIQNRKTSPQPSLMRTARLSQVSSSPSLRVQANLLPPNSFGPTSLHIRA